jgi:translation initiation factor SUI1
VSFSTIHHPPTYSLTTAPLLDPFADEGDPLGGNQDVGSTQNYLHIRIQQRNGRKTLTTLQGLPKGELAVEFVAMQFLNLSQNMTPRNSSKLSKRFF